MTTCPGGGAIVHWLQGQTTDVTQGAPLSMPRGINYAPNGDPTGNLMIADGIRGIFSMAPSGGTPSKLASGPPSSPRDVMTDPNGNFLVVDWPELNGVPITFTQLGITPAGGTPKPSVPGATPAAVYRVTPSGQVSTVYSGPPLLTPHGITMDSAGNILVADVAAGLIRISPSGQATVVAAARTPGGLVSAQDVAVDSAGNYIVADADGGALRKVTPTGTVTTIHRGAPFTSLVPRSGSGPSAGPVTGPRGVVIEADGSYDVVDQGAQALFHVTVSGVVTTIAQGGLICDPADLTIVHD